MPKLRKVAGAWRDTAARYRKVDGQWRRVKESYRKIDGRWVKIFSSIYAQMYIINPNPDNFDAGISYDSATDTYTAHLYAKENTDDLAEVGIRVGNIPANSTVGIKLTAFDGVVENNSVQFYGNGKLLSSYGYNTLGASYTIQAVNNDLVLCIQLKGKYLGYTKKNFKLSNFTINGAPVPAP